ncbi:MAG: beta-N-acetylhexosaminidase [Gammaproteobacteria bacterium]
MTIHPALGPVMLDVEGLTLAAHEIDKIRHPNTGAVILFARNYESPEQVEALITSIRRARGSEILIAVDQEGGRVQRFQCGFTRLPPAARYAKKPELAEAAGWLMAAELLAVGVDFSFAPVLDVDCGVSRIIGDRSFSTDPQLAAELASAFRKGMRAAGMAATGKHFPGHGWVAPDSHLALPVDERDLDSILARDLIPFRRLISEGLEGVMPAHIVYSAIDERPAGFSPFWIQQILRGQLGFNGVVFSDDLSMAGASWAGGYPERAQMALDAGCDMVLVCNNPTAAEDVIEKLPIRNQPLRESRLASMRGKTQFNREQLPNSVKWRHISDLINHTFPLC